MFTFWAFALIAVVWIQVFQLRSRLAEVEDRLRAMGNDYAPTPSPAPPQPPPLEPVAPMPVQPPPIPQPEPVRVLVEQEVIDLPIPVPPPLPAPTYEPPPRRDWESMIGGNLLNKLGALVLVIGIALFLSYSVANMGPAGRALTAVGVSGAILAAGVWMERKPQFRIFSRGLIASGWASLYFTSYAIHALEATRILNDPLTALLLMLGVGAGMIAHSLKYRQQALTALAYGCAFAALALTGLTAFSAVALIPLAGSLLYLARRLGWYEMALFGAGATYATFISHPASGASLASIQAMLVLFWVLFEGFDLLRIFDRRPATFAHHAHFAVNAAAGLGVSAALWYRMAPEQMWLFCAGAALLYTISTIARLLLGEGSRYEASLTLSALLAGLAIFAHVTGIWTSLALMLEAEVLFLAGLYLRLRFARVLSIAGFLWSVLQLSASPGTTEVLGVQLNNWAPPLAIHALLFYLNRYLAKSAPYFSYAATTFIVAVLGEELPWRHVAGGWLVFAAVLLEFGIWKGLCEFRYQGYALAVLGAAAASLGFLDANSSPHAWAPAVGGALSLAYAVRATRFLNPLDDWEQRALRVGGSIGTALLGGIFLTRVLPEPYWGVSLLAASALMLELGLRGWPAEMRVPALVLNAAALVNLRFAGPGLVQKSPEQAVWVSYCGAAVIYYWIAGRLLPRENEGEPILSQFGLALGSSFGLASMWMLLPDSYVPAAFVALAIAATELSVVLRADGLAWHGRGVSLVATAFWAYAMLFAGTFAYLPNGILLATVHLYLWVRNRSARLAFLHGWIAVALAGALMWLKAPHYTLALWSLLGVSLAVSGRFFGVRQLRWQAASVAAVMFLVGAFENKEVWQLSAAVACFLCALVLEPREGAGQRLRQGYSLLAGLLTALTLYREVSGGMLTLSWGLEGIALLGAGFAVRERTLRLSGLVLLLGCIGKLFVYDLRNLETMFRILSFIGLGAILLGVSWIYARFKDQLQRLL